MHGHAFFKISFDLESLPSFDKKEKVPKQIQLTRDNPLVRARNLSESLDAFEERFSLAKTFSGRAFPVCSERLPVE